MLEVRLLANLLLQGNLGKAKGKLVKGDFRDERCWRLYEEMHRIEGEYGHFTRVLLDERLKLGDGFYSYLERFATIPSDIPILVRQMKGETWKRKALDLFGLARCPKCNVPILDTKEVRSTPAPELRERIRRFLSEYELVGGKAFSMAEALRDIMEYLDERKEDRMMPTPWMTLNRYIGGLVKGKLYILGGRPSMGKTTMMDNIVLSFAHRGLRSLIFQLEGTVRSGLMRMVSILSRVENKKVWEGDLDEEEFGRVTDAMEKLSELPIVFSTYHRPTLSQMREEIEMYEPDIVCLDYLQLLRLGDIPGEKKYQQLGYVVNEFADMCAEYDICFLCLSQLSREVEHRNPPQPVLSDLRESGDIEQAADVVIFLSYPYKLRHTYRDWQDAGMDQLFFHVAKNRDGACSDWLSLRFVPQHYLLEDEE